MKLTTKLLFIALTSVIVGQTNAQILGSLNFNGSDNFVEIANSPMNAIDTGDFTIEAWIRGNEADQTNHPMILSNRGTDAFGGGIAFFFHDAWGVSQSKMLCFQINADNYLIIDNGSFNGSVLDGQCRHVAISRNGNILTFYIDGSEIGNKTLPSASTVNFNGPLLIGKDKAINNTFNGIISQCRIWNIARTQIQINDSKETRLQGNETGLIAYWEMNNENSQTVTDKTGQFNGVLGNSVGVESQDPSWSGEGCIEESVVSTDNNTKSYFLKVLPNPTSGIITIQHQNEKNVTLKITNASGNLLLIKPLNETTLSIDISDYPNDVYFLQLQFEDHIITRKIVKL